MAEKKKVEQKAVARKAVDSSAEQKADALERWLSALIPDSFSDWGRLPDIGLYMDQVLTMMDRQMGFYKRADEDRSLTQSMINNYTKDGILPRATDKKYNQSHLALLSILCSLKPILSISDMKSLFSVLCEEEGEREAYDFFLAAQMEALGDVKKQTLDDLAAARSASVSGETAGDEAGSGDGPVAERALASLALRLCVDARVRLLVTQGILDLFCEKED